MITPADFGAAGDGRKDDTRALQAALDKAEGSALSLAGRSYAVSAPLLVPSGTIVDGMGAVICMRADDRPVLASRAYMQAAPLRGRTRIANLRIEGTGRGAGQDGIVLHDFWSEIADVEVFGVGGRGIVLSAANRAGQPVSSTLVENRIRRVAVRGSGGTAFFLGEAANGKLTDGELTDCIAMLGEAVREPALFLGHAAGWSIRGLHTYGGRPDVAIEVVNAYFTRLSDIYCESFARTALNLRQVQTHVAASGLQLVAERPDANAAFIALSAHRDFPAPAVSLSGIGLHHLGSQPVAMLANDGGRVATSGERPMVGGPGAAAITAGDWPASGSRAVSWTGREPRTVEIAVKAGEAAFAQAHGVTITGRSMDGALTTQFAGMLHWSRAQANGHAVLVDLVPFGSAVGFQQPPLASFRRDGTRLVLTLAFTPVATGPGMLAISC